MVALATLGLGCSPATTGSQGSERLASSVPEKVAPYRPAPGEGVICALAIFSAMSEVGSRRFPGEDAEFQSELARSVTRLDEYVLRNSERTIEDLSAFKKEQAHIGAPQAAVCHEEAIDMYRHMASRGPERLKSGTDELVARPGEPKWGDCL